MNYKEKKKNQILEYKNTINKYEKKVRLNLNCFFIFLSYLFIYSIEPIFGYIPFILFGIGLVFFLQQLVRSYNYLKFHKTSLKTLMDLHKIIDKKKGS